MYFMWLDWRGSNPLWAFIYKSLDFLWASWQKEYFTFIFLCWSISSLFSSETHFFPLLWHFTSFYRDFLCFYHLFLSFYWFIDLFLFILRGVFIYYSLFYTVIIKSFHICTDACGVWQRQEVNSSSSAGMWWSVTVVLTAASRCFILIRQMGVRTKAAIVCPLNKRKYCLEFSRKMNLVFWSSLFFVI